MLKWNLLLAAALIASSLMLVKTSYESRRLFNAIDRERALAQTLEAEHGRLAAERQAQTTPLRIERVARDKLGMRVATAAVTEYVHERAAAGAAR